MVIIIFNIECKGESVSKRRGRTAIFSVNVARKRLIEHTTNLFRKSPNLTKQMLMETLSEDFEPLALEIYEFENRQN